jgi:hypothetical protein
MSLVVLVVVVVGAGDSVEAELRTTAEVLVGGPDSGIDDVRKGPASGGVVVDVARSTASV